MGTRPLEGIRVIDMADEKGELCGRLLADLGADVVRVEPPGGGSSRRLAPLTRDAQSLYFAFRNAGKRGVTLDLASEGGRDQLARLLDGADIWIETSQTGHACAPGFEPAKVLERNPSLVITSITDFGQTGPYAGYQGTDMIGFAYGGLMHRAGAPHRPPLVAPGNLAYDTTSVTAAFATLMACWQRLGTGRGQHLDVSVAESTAQISDWSLPGYSQSKMAGARAGAGIYPLYACADGFVRLIIIGTHHWRALLEWMGNPDELSDPELEQFITRLMQRERIDPVIGAFFRAMKKIDIAREAQSRGIPCTPLLRPAEVIENEHCVARGTFRRMEVLPGVEGAMASGFYELDGVRTGPRGRAPTPGEHNDEIFGALGVAASDPETARAEQGAAASSSPPYPFAGLRVLDFGVGAVGVEVGRLLAEYGADVIKVESNAAPDFIRIVMPGGINPAFASSSRSKRSLGINLKTKAGLDLLFDLVRMSDILVENNGAGVMDRLGLGYDVLHRINPRLIMFSSHLVGSSGPWKDWVGYGPNTHPVSGLQYLWNYPEDADQPAGSTNVYPDHLVGRVGMGGIVAALIERERSGEGSHVEAAQFESAIGFLGDLLLKESIDPGSVAPQGNANERGAPWGAYPCSGEDQWCVINVRSDAEWSALAGAIGEDWAAAPAYTTREGRLAARERLDEQLAAWTRARANRELMEELQGLGVPASVMSTPADHLDDPHLHARGYPRPIEQQGVGPIVLEGPAFYGSQLPQPVITQAPMLGEHTREVCRELLELDDAEIERLVADGVLEPYQPES